MQKKFQLNTAYNRAQRLVLAAACLGFLTLTACSRGSGDQSKIEIQLPAHPSINEKSANLQAQSSELPYCYLVNIVGDGITATSNSCYPKAGIRSSFMPPLSSLSMEVPKGTKRQVELYGYIPLNNESCGGSGLDLHTVPLNRLFRLAIAENIDMTADETGVRLNVVHPGLHNHIGIQTEQASSCYAHLPPLNAPAAGTPVADILKGSRFQIAAEISAVGLTQVQTGSRFKIEYEVRHDQQ